MELKLSVSIGATLQVKNAKGEWDWIKPEVGCEVKLVDGEIKVDVLPEQFAAMWDDIVGPQFSSVVQELIREQAPKPVEEAATEETIIDDTIIDDSKVVTTDEDEYY